MLIQFNLRTRATASSLAFAALAATTANTPTQAAQVDKWWLRAGVLPATSTLRLREVDLNVRSLTGMPIVERQCEVNGTLLPVMTGIIPDTGNFYAVSLKGKNNQCTLLPLVNIKPRNPATAQELMAAMIEKVPTFAKFVEGQLSTGIPEVDQLLAPRPMRGLGFVMPKETTVSYMLMLGINELQQQMGLPTAHPCPAAGPDSDGDGLPDSVEQQGVLDLDGTLFRSNPNKADSDDDGLTDGEEIGEPLDFATAQQRARERNINPATLDRRACYYDVYSNPLSRDTDGDLLEDALELDQGSNPRKRDTDGDGLSDAGERLWGTDPLNRDTDGDGLNDSTELSLADAGFNPLVFNRSIFKPAYLKSVEAGAQAFKGGLCGDICELETIPELMGAMAMSVMPVAGTAADVRDVFANTIKGNLVNATLAATGIIPVGGDAARLGNMAASFLRKHPGAFEPVLQIISRADFIPDTMRASVMRRAFTEVAAETFHGLTVRHGISEQTLIRLSGNTRNMKTTHLLEVLDECGGCIRRDVADFSKNGWMEVPVKAEEHLRQGRSLPITMPPQPRGRTDVRRYDDINVDVAREAKTGFVAADRRIMRQIEKDCAMKINKFSGIKTVEWHFYASHTSSSIGAAPEVLQALKSCKNGAIPFYFHMP